MQAVQREIAEQLNVQPPFADYQALEAEVARRITFIQDCLTSSGLKTLVLGISGGVDSLTAGLLAQRAMRELRERTGDEAYKFIAVRLPYDVQFDEHDAQASVDFIAPDERHTVNIGPAVKSSPTKSQPSKASTRCRWISCSATPRRGCVWSPSTPLPARPMAW